MAAIILFSKKRIASAILRPFYYRLAPKKYREKMKSVYTEFYSGIELMYRRKKVLITVIILTFIVWLGTMAVIYFIGLSLGIEIPFDFLLIVFPIITLLEALPISFSGVGTRDAAMIFFLSFIAITAEASVSISLMYLLITYIFGFVGFGLWYRNPIKIRETE